MPRALENGAHGTTRDHTSTRRRRLHQHLAGAMLAHDFVRDGRTRERDHDHVATRAINGLADRFRHFVRLARRETHFALSIADRKPVH
jgi:hypothetical protein